MVYFWSLHNQNFTAVIDTVENEFGYDYTFKCDDSFIAIHYATQKKHTHARNQHFGFVKLSHDKKFKDRFSNWNVLKGQDGTIDLNFKLFFFVRVFISEYIKVRFQSYRYSACTIVYFLLIYFEYCIRSSMKWDTMYKINSKQFNQDFVQCLLVVLLCDVSQLKSIQYLYTMSILTMNE